MHSLVSDLLEHRPLLHCHGRRRAGVPRLPRASVQGDVMEDNPALKQLLEAQQRCAAGFCCQLCSRRHGGMHGAQLTLRVALAFHRRMQVRRDMLRTRKEAEEAARADAASAGGTPTPWCVCWL